MSNTSIRRRIAALGAAAVLSGGLLAATAAPASAAAPQTARTPLTATAGTWVHAGIFPDPISCAVAGSLTGLPYYCSWSVFWFNLYVEV